MKDTYNLLADGINVLARELAAGTSCSDPKEEWAREHGLGRYYFGSSLKGEAGIDWDDPEARRVFLQSVVADADRLLTVAREAMERFPAGDPERRRLHDAALLLERVLTQDIERREDGTSLKQGVSPDRVVSVHDPEMRHGRKSEKRRFDGHKAHLAVDPESQLIMAADVLAGNAPDHERALELVEQVEANADFVVEEVVGECAYGDGDTRRTFADAGRNLVAKVANRRGGAQFPKDDFRIDLEAMSCVCPAGQKTQKVVSISSGDRYGAPGVPFAGVSLRRGPLRRMPAQVLVHAGAARQRSAGYDPPAGGGSAAGGEGIPAKRETFAPYGKLRQAAEHRLARLMQLGVRQARYTSVGRRPSSNSLWPLASPISRSWRRGSASCETATTLRRSSLYISTL